MTRLKDAPGMTAPVGSDTVPEMLPPVAAYMVAAAIRKNTIAKFARLALTLVSVKINRELSICTSLTGVASSRNP